MLVLFQLKESVHSHIYPSNHNITHTENNKYAFSTLNIVFYLKYIHHINIYIYIIIYIYVIIHLWTPSYNHNIIWSFLWMPSILQKPATHLKSKHIWLILNSHKIVSQNHISLLIISINIIQNHIIINIINVILLTIQMVLLTYCPSCVFINSTNP